MMYREHIQNMFDHFVLSAPLGTFNLTYPYDSW
jgi:hypothetical protein